MSETQQNTVQENSFGLKSVSKGIAAGGYAYLCLGMAMAVWASLIPFAKARLQVNEAELGMLLLCLGGGAFLAMPVAGALTARFGCRAMQIIGIPVYYTALFLLSFAPTPLTLALSLLCFGAFSGFLDVVMNIQVALLEQASKKRLMSTLHAMYMIGAAAGAGSMSVLLSFLKNPMYSTSLLCLAVIVALLYFQNYFFPKTEQKNEEKTPLIVIPKGIIFWLGLICFFLYMIEGVLMDWSALFMNQIKHVPLSQSGLGYAIFAVTMTCGRLIGDRLGARFGSRFLLFYGVLGCVLSLWIVSFVPGVAVTFLAFFLLGCFASNTVPMLFSLVTKNIMGSLSISIAGVSTIGYLGLLAGPAIMGFVAHNIGLEFVFFVLSIFLAFVALLLYKLKMNE